MSPSPPPLHENQPLAPFTTWQIGGPARWFAEPRDPQELAACLVFARDRGLPVFALGGASNVLVSDRGFPGLAVRYLDDSETLEVAPDGHSAQLRVGSRALLSRLARRGARQGWAGLEWAEGIPGTVGGAIVGNAGAYGGEISGIVERVGVVAIDDPEEGPAALGAISDEPATRLVREWSAPRCRFAYRTSRFKELGAERAFVVHATLRLRRGDPDTLTARLREIGERRKAASPAGKSCGSVFQNPPGDHAGRLVQAAGLRGRVQGHARIAPEHGNYIVNMGGATAADVLALIVDARLEVARQSGIVLQPEVRLVGFTPAELAPLEVRP